MAGILICSPVSMNWDPNTPGGKCGNEVLVFAAVGITDLFTDFVILVLPLPMVCRLHLKWQDKAALFFIFGTGTL